MGVEQAGKRVIDQKEIFALAQGGEWVEPPEFGIDETGVAHHHAPVRQPAKKLGKDLEARGHSSRRRVYEQRGRIPQRADRAGISGSRQNRPTTASRCRIVLHTAI
jgi:hypothetical protein